MRILLGEWIVAELVELRKGFEHSELELCDRIHRHRPCSAALLHRKKLADGTWTEWRVYPQPDMTVARADFEDRVSVLGMKEVSIEPKVVDRVQAPSPYESEPLYGAF